MDNSLEQESKSIEQQAFDIYYRCIKQIPDIPEDTIIYHYTSPEGILGITESNSLWATDINYLNDSSELRYIYGLVERIVKAKLKEWNPDFCTRILKLCDHWLKKYDLSNRLLFAYKRDSYVISFSLDQDNLNMWKCYTKTGNSMGYNIGFMKKELISNIPEPGLLHLISGKVIYDEVQQEKILTDLLSEYEHIYVQYLAEPKKDRIFSIIGIPLGNLGVFFKHHAFYDENEFRIVLQDHIFPGKPGLYKIDYRIKDGVFIPYTKLESPAEAIKSIGISPSEKQQMAEFSVERMLGPKYHLNYGDFFRSKIPYSP